MPTMTPTVAVSTAELLYQLNRTADALRAAGYAAAADRVLSARDGLYYEDGSFEF